MLEVRVLLGLEAELGLEVVEFVRELEVRVMEFLALLLGKVQVRFEDSLLFNKMRDLLF